MDNPASFVFVMTGMFVFYAWVAWIILEWRKAGRKSQLHQKLMDRFESAADLQTFLQSEGGERFLKSMGFEGLSPKQKIMASFSRAVVTVFVGVAVLIVGTFMPEDLKIGLPAGIIILGLGLGLFVSALISLKLSKKWGIFNQ
jgi:hypothetical protein